MPKIKAPSPPIVLEKSVLDEPSSKRRPFPIVGIGASAGGLEAFEQFFLHTPADIGMSFVLIPHLDPDHASLLSEILQRCTSMPVVEAMGQQVIKPNSVYVIPPNRNMTISHGKLQLSEPHEPRGIRMPIDGFLNSLAEDQQENAIGIVLSGTGSDGTLGLRAIHGLGGITMAQEPATAKYDGMPSSAIRSGYVTLVLPVEKMSEVLQTGARAYITSTEVLSESKISGGINRILLKLRAITGHDFSLYKRSTIGRRIERRMLQHGIEDIDVYARFLKENPPEAHALFKELLINVTSFFRDPESFALLKNKILPDLCQDKPDDYVFRVWVAGCATGEEAYSIAILLREWMDENNHEIRTQIYATDLDDDAIATARAGLYLTNIAQDVSQERIRRFFIKEDAGYRVKKEIREMVVFAVQNVIKDPPFTKLDLLCCRNLMIYLGPELQNRLIPVFHYALKPGGILFLSPSESINNYVELFLPLDRKWKFFSATQFNKTTRSMLASGQIYEADSINKKTVDNVTKIKETNYAELMRRALVQYFAPASVITDVSGNILYVYGETGRYLRPAPGDASLNVLEMARDGLDIELRRAIRAVGEGASTLNREAQVRTNGGFSAVNFSVRILVNSNNDKNLLLLSFQDVPSPTVKPSRKRVSKPAELNRIDELERELAYLKESHRTTLEEQQVSNEELKSTNEEMQSTNEELQSSNEELETSKEELQSVNEELITVNSELQSKIEQLSGMQNDMKNLLDNINVGIIFLDRHLLIRSFTREAVHIYRLVASDVGRSLADIRSMVQGEDLMIAARHVLDSLIPYEHEIQIGDDIWMLARIQPYRTLDNVIDGVVLTFTDITSRIKIVAAQEALALAEGVVNTVREPLIVMDGTLTVVSASQSFYRDFQVNPNETVGRKLYELAGAKWISHALSEQLKEILPGNKVLENYLLEYDFPVIGHRKLKLNARRVIGITGEAQLILLSMEILP